MQGAKKKNRKKINKIICYPLIDNRLVPAVDITGYSETGTFQATQSCLRLRGLIQSDFIVSGRFTCTSRIDLYLKKSSSTRKLCTNSKC